MTVMNFGRDGGSSGDGGCIGAVERVHENRNEVITDLSSV